MFAVKSALDNQPDLNIIIDEEEISIENEGEFLEIRRADEIGEFYDDDEKSIINYFNERKFYIVGFRSIEFLKRILIAIVDRADIYVDNDFGLMLPGNEFVMLLKSRPGWDWLYD